MALRRPPVEAVPILVPRGVGLGAMAILGDRCGAVLEDGEGLRLYWFVAKDTAEDWNVGSTRCVRSADLPPVPPPNLTAGPGPRWRMCPGDNRWLTNTAALKAALADAFSSAPAVRNPTAHDTPRAS
ncbi:hypothetical protein [Streptomyces sp. NBC_00859]|uniref:hypothetical protein n=1 Tax=Streptomyces sp. NBC_00859 TaxID=2903682 RepID=UPI00386BD924|nr:hypothetical protein OG584_09135 [Streptomyces sp. NBC_00859]